MELGIYTFAELTSDEISAQQRLRDLLAEIELADQLGLDVFGVGEHHRPDFAVSAPAVVLAAAAERTTAIRLTSAVSVLSSDDPVRVFQDFATLDLISNGRAEIMAGRGSFIESFPLFGYDLRDYDALFDEKLRLLLALRRSERISWAGGHRSPIDDRGVYPRPRQDPLPVWVAVGGSPESAVRAGSLGLPMALAIIGGLPERFVPFTQLHRQAGEEAGHDRLALGINSHGFIAETSQAALEDSYPYVAAMMDRIGRERGWAPTHPSGLRGSRDPARRQLRRQPGSGDREDPLPARAVRPRPLPRPVQRRNDAAREDHALDRAVRHRGRARRSPRAHAAAGLAQGGASLAPGCRSEDPPAVSWHDRRSRLALRPGALRSRPPRGDRPPGRLRPSGARRSRPSVRDPRAGG